MVHNGTPSFQDGTLNRTLPPLHMAQGVYVPLQTGRHRLLLLLVSSRQGSYPRTLTALRRRQGLNLHASFELATWFRIKRRRHLSAGSSMSMNGPAGNRTRSLDGGLVYHWYHSAVAPFDVGRSCYVPCTGFEPVISTLRGWRDEPDYLQQGMLCCFTTYRGRDSNPRL